MSGHGVEMRRRGGSSSFSSTDSGLWTEATTPVIANRDGGTNGLRGGPAHTGVALGNSGRSGGTNTANSTAANNTNGRGRSHGPQRTRQSSRGGRVADRPLAPPEFSVRGSLEFSMRYLLRATWRDLGGWGVGVLTVFLVVMFLSLLQNNIIKSPLVFMRLSEDNAGEMDLVLTPSPTATQPTFFLNYTAMNASMEDNATLVAGGCPRWYMLGKIQNRDKPWQESSGMFVVVNSKLEDSIGLGRAWKHRPLGEAETHVTASLLREIGITANRGQRVILTLDLNQLAMAFGQDDLLAGLDGADFGANAALAALFDAGTINGTNLILPANDNTTDLLLIAIGVDPTTVDPATKALILQSLGADGDVIVVDLVALSTLVGQDVTDGQISSAALFGGTNTSLTISAEYTVVDGIKYPKGKYPAQLGNVMLLEKEFVQKLLVEQVVALLDNVVVSAALTGQGIDVPATRDFWTDTFQIDEYALTVCVMYTDRAEAYKTQDEELENHMRIFSNDVLESIGYTAAVDVVLPVYSGLGASFFIRLFLDQLFLGVTSVLVLLGAMLIYSLLLSDVENKTYEYGMLRALGMRHYTLIELLVNQALLFAVPGILAGIFAAFLINAPIAYIISTKVYLPADYSFAWQAARTALLIGLAMPLVANYVPIQRALSKTLRDALDIYHQVVSETTVTVIRLESLGLSAWQTALSIMLVVFGFVTYYMIPYSFTYNNLQLFFAIMVGILLGMVLGLALMSSLLQPSLESFVLKGILWGKDRRLETIVKKNLQGHRRRNQKTALMFTISLAFMVFAGTQFTLLIDLIGDNIEMAFGADIVVFAPGEPEAALDEDSMRNYLKRSMEDRDSYVAGFTFMTYQLWDMPNVEEVGLSNLVNFPDEDISLYGVEENYLEATYSKFLITTEYDRDLEYDRVDGKRDIVKSLFKDKGNARLPVEGDDVVVPPVLWAYAEGYEEPFEHMAEELEIAYTEYIDLIMSEAMRDAVSVDTDTALYMHVGTVNEAEDGQLSPFYVSSAFLGKARAMVKKMPGFFFSSYRQTADDSAVIVTVDEWQKIYDIAFNATQYTPPDLGGGDSSSSSTGSGTSGSSGSGSSPYSSTSSSTSTSPTEKTYYTVPPKGTLLVTTTEDADLRHRETIINGLRNFIADDRTLVFDTVALIDQTKTATDLLILFFNVVAVIASVLSFFVLFLSFTANMAENAWEFGVLRALGLSAYEVLRVYVYEALALVVAAIILGTLVGVLTAITLTLQFLLFTENPFEFLFPFSLYLSVVAMSIILTFFGSWLPARAIMKKPVAEAIRS